MQPMLWWCSSAAWSADPPPVQVGEEDGTVVAIGVVPASEDKVRAVLDDTGGRMKDLFPDVLSVTFTADGACQDVHRQTRGLFSPLDLHVRRCPTPGGFREDLVPGGSVFRAYSSEWRLSPVDGGTRVEYRVSVALSLPVPSSMVTSGTEASSKAALERMIAGFSTGGGAR